MATSAVRMARYRERQVNDECIVTICVNRTELVDMLTTSRTLDPALADNEFMIARAVERFLKIFMMKGPPQ